jgi:hypothetical protein
MSGGLRQTPRLDGPSSRQRRAAAGAISFLTFRASSSRHLSSAFQRRNLTDAAFTTRGGASVVCVFAPSHLLHTNQMQTAKDWEATAPVLSSSLQSDDMRCSIACHSRRLRFLRPRTPGASLFHRKVHQCCPLGLYQPKSSNQGWGFRRSSARNLSNTSRLPDVWWEQRMMPRDWESWKTKQSPPANTKYFERCPSI